MKKSHQQPGAPRIVPGGALASARGGAEPRGAHIPEIELPPIGGDKKGALA
jgi:hypothetical protein